MESCTIHSKPPHSLFNIRFSNLILSQISATYSSLVYSQFPSSIEITKSSFKDIVSEGGNVVMRGRAEREIIRECAFENVSMRGGSTRSVPERCDVEGSMLKEVERGRWNKRFGVLRFGVL